METEELLKIYKKIHPEIVSAPLDPGAGRPEMSPENYSGPAIDMPYETQRVELIFGSGVHIPKSIPAAIISEIKEKFTFKNPHYFMAIHKQLTPPDKFFLAYFETEDDLVVPDGGIRRVINIFQKHKISIFLNDQSESHPITPHLVESLLPAGCAKMAVSDLVEKRFFILNGDRGGDGIFPAIRIMAARSEKTLIVVKRIPQLYFWKNHLIKHIMIQNDDIGLVGDSFDQIDRNIVIAIDRSLYRHTNQISTRFGFLIIDRCDLANPKIFFHIVWRMKSKYVLGISEFTKREDGLDSFMRSFLGEMVFWGKTTTAHGTDPGVDIVEKHTRINVDSDEYTDIIRFLCDNEERSRMMVSDILSVVSSGRSRVVVISPQIDHLKKIQELLSENYRESVMIFGKTGPKRIDRAANDFNEKKILVFLTTVKSMGISEIDPVDGVFVAAPFKNRETASSILLGIKAGGKIYEYIDDNDFCRRAFEKRKAFYKKIA